LTELEGNSQNEEQRDFVYGNYLDEVLMVMVDDGQNQTDHYYARDHLFSLVGWGLTPRDFFLPDPEGVEQNIPAGWHLSVFQRGVPV